MSPVFVGCDDGYAEIKVAWLAQDSDEVQTLQFPSRVASGINTSDVSGRASNRAYVTGGHEYTVLPTFDAIDTRFDEYPLSDVNRVLVHHALREAGLWGRDVALCTGLPPGAYFSGVAGVNDRLLRAKEESLRKPVRAMAALDPARIRDCHICPEGVAAAMDHMFRLDGSIENPVEGVWAIVDIGGRTTDVVTIVWEDGLSIDHQRTGSINVGVMKAIDLVAKRVADEHDVSVSDIGDLDTVIRERYVSLFGRREDVGRQVESAIGQVGEEILLFCRRRIGNAARMSKVIFVGGGAECFRPVLEGFRGRVIPDKPAFANARGMLKFAKINAG